MLDRRAFRQNSVDGGKQHRANQRAIKRSRPAKQNKQEYEDGEIETDEIRVDVLVLLRDQRARYSAGDGCNYKRQDFIPVDADTNGLRGNLIRLQRKEGAPEPATEEVAQEQMGDRAQRDAKPNPMQ